MILTKKKGGGPEDSVVHRNLLPKKSVLQNTKLCKTVVVYTYYCTSHICLNNMYVICIQFLKCYVCMVM